ncbi:hypothetical protein [Rubellimicrobium arenae]|uniref:hypothetical protein n=1 Tax=Rubellimicrobium arenae TaxID=2817372 RepID=UPI001B30A702|nr:hypothetical protein [Rubellimicrobium arenae]
MRRDLRPYPHILRMHVEESSFLWLQWRDQQESPAIDRNHTRALERRLGANLAALTLDPEGAHRIASENLELYGGGGEVFVASWLAILDGSLAQQEDLFRRFGDGPARNGILGAVAWSDPVHVRQALPGWVGRGSPEFLELAVAACLALAIDPKARLRDLIGAASPRLRAAALGLAAMLGRVDVAAQVLEAADDSDPGVAAQALHAAVLLGMPQAVLPHLTGHALSDDPLSGRSALLLVLAAPDREARDRIKILWQAGAPAQAVRVAALVDGEDVTQWIVRQMSVPDLMLAAGLAFADRFALEAAATDLYTSEPKDLESGLASAVPEDSVDLYPIAGRVKEWLRTHGPREVQPFRSNRLRMIRCLKDALAAPDTPLVDWTLPTERLPKL